MNGYKTVEEILNERRTFKVDQQLIQEGGGKTTLSVMGMIINIPLLGIPHMTYRSIKAAGSDAHRVCGKFGLNTSARQLCIMRYKVKSYQKTVELAKQLDNFKLEKKAGIKLLKAKKQLKKLELSLAKHGKSERKPSTPVTQA
jgi:hypothetical protein